MAARRHSLDASPPILVEHRPDRIVVVTLNRPAKRNALDFSLLETLTATMRAVGEDVGAVILRGAGGAAFSAGFDLDELTGEATDLEADAAIGRAAEALSGCEAPVIAQIGGHCHGGAVDLALNCDLRVASVDLQLSLRAVSLGVVYRPQLLARMIDTIGLGRTQQLLFAMPVLDAAQALAWGLVSEVVPADQLGRRVEAIATALAGAPVSAVRGTKASLALLTSEPGADVLAAANEWRAAAAVSEERKLALAAAQARVRNPGRPAIGGRTAAGRNRARGKGGRPAPPR